MREESLKERRAYGRKMAIRNALRKALIVLAVIVFCGSCSGITYLIGTGAWHGLVSLINAIIEGGPAVIIATIVSLIGANYLLACCAPLAVIVVIVALIIYSQR